MKYLLILVSILIFFWALSANSQSLTLSYDGEDVSNDEIFINGNSSDEEIKVNLFITNNSDTDIDIKVKKIVRVDLEGSDNTFCLGNCFPPDVYETPDPYTLEAGETTEEGVFYAQFFPNNNDGEALIVYEVFNVDDEDDKVTVGINFIISHASSTELDLNQISLNAFPNPSSNGYVSINYGLPTQLNNSKLVVYNILGVKIYEQLLLQPSGKILLDATKMPRGIYLYSIETKSKRLMTKRLMIN